MNAGKVTLKTSDSASRNEYDCSKFVSNNLADVVTYTMSGSVLQLENCLEVSNQIAPCSRFD